MQEQFVVIALRDIEPHEELVRLDETLHSRGLWTGGWYFLFAILIKTFIGKSLFSKFKKSKKIKKVKKQSHQKISESQKVNLPRSDFFLTFFLKHFFDLFLIFFRLFSTVFSTFF